MCFLKLNLTDKGRRCEMAVRERNGRKKHGKEPEFFFFKKTNLCRVIRKNSLEWKKATAISYVVAP